MKIQRNTFFLTVFFLLTLTAKAQDSDRVANAQTRLLQRADSLMAKHKFEQAFHVLMGGDSLDVDVLLRRGQCQARMGASGGAIRPYESILRMDSTHLNALVQVAPLYARDGEFAKALTCYLRLIHLDSVNSYYSRQAGTMAARMDDKVAARFWLKRTLDLNPADVEAALALGNILMELEEYRHVDSLVQQTLSLEPHYKPLLVLRARSAFEQQQYESTVIAVNQLLERSDTTALYARLLGVSYFNLKEYDKLVTCMNFLLKNRHDNEWIFYYLGLASRELGDVPTSIAFFKQAVQKSISENTKVYYSQLGQSYEKMGDYQEAIRAYRAAYDYSKEGILLYHLARNYDYYYKDKTTALAYYRRYLESDDTIRLAREYARKRMQDMGDF